MLGSVNLVLASAPPRNNLLFYTNYHMKAANVILLQLRFMFQNCKWHRAVHICLVLGNNPSSSSPFLIFALHFTGKYHLFYLLLLVPSINILLQIQNQLSIWDSGVVRNIIGSCKTYPLRMKLDFAGWLTAVDGAGLLELPNGTLLKQSFKQNILNFNTAQQ